MKISKNLLVRDINGYSEDASQRKKLFHKDGKAFFRQLATALNLPNGFRITSNLGGVAVCGEVTLHSEHLYLSMTEGSGNQGVRILYRGCDGMRDFAGHQNNWATLSDLDQDPSKLERFLAHCRQINDRYASAV